MILTDIVDLTFAGIPAADAGQVDRLLCDLATRLERDGVRLAGAVQSDIKRQNRCRCDMSLRVLGSGNRYPISSNRGPLSQGCRLDSGALECAAWEVESLLRGASNEALPQLLIVNKFSKSEAHGKGFATCIAVALERGVSVLCGIGRLSLAEFQGFTDDQAELLKPNKQAIEQWVQSRALTPTSLSVLAHVPARRRKATDRYQAVQPSSRQLDQANARHYSSPGEHVNSNASCVTGPLENSVPLRPA